MEKVAAKSRSSQAKVIGSIISIAGAFVVTFYKGPSINVAQTHLSLPLQQQISFLHSVDTSWAIAGILLTADYLLVSLWYILQVHISCCYLMESFNKLVLKNFNSYIHFTGWNLEGVPWWTIYGLLLQHHCNYCSSNCSFIFWAKCKCLENRTWHIIDLHCLLCKIIPLETAASFWPMKMHFLS